MIIANPMYDVVFKRLMEITKNFTHPADIDELKTMTDILHYVGTDPQERKQIELEQEAWRTVNAMFADKKRKYQKALAESEKALKQNQETLLENHKALEANQNALQEKEKLIEELTRKLNEQK